MRDYKHYKTREKENITHTLGIISLLIVCVILLMAILHLDAVEHYRNLPVFAAIELNTCGVDHERFY